jgi:putative DNA methylase
MRELNSNALATYVVLVCRPRPDDLRRLPRSDFATSLRAELGPAIRLLQSAAIAPVDLAQAVIGPGMAVFTRYSSVVEADGSAMSTRSALLLINSVLAEVLDEQEGDYDADTRWAVTWFEQHRFSEAASGEADALARAKVTSIAGLERAGIIDTRGGRTRLKRREELLAEYEPSRDSRPTVWEAVQYLVKALEAGGEIAAATLLSRLPNADEARELTYRLYSICERKSWAEEAVSYNMLAASWAEIVRLSTETQLMSPTQQTLEM